jgi:hypothetical protein
MASAYRELVSSGVLDWLAEYSTDSQTIGRGRFLGATQIAPDGSRGGALVTDANVQAELAAQIAGRALPAPDDNTLYMVHLPAEKTSMDPSGALSCSSFCAYHGTFRIGSQDVVYAVLPDIAGAGCATGCGGDSAFDNQTAVASHELVAAITDPQVGLASVIGPPIGWYDGDHVDPQTGRPFGEIADICHGQHGSFIGADGLLYTMQREFSNRVADCITARSGGFVALVQRYPGLDFGLPSAWDAISGDFDGDGRADYARLGDTEAWVFFGNGDGTFNRAFQSYHVFDLSLSFGVPSPWQTVSGDFNGDGRTDYARLGETGAWVFFGRADRTFGPGFQVYDGIPNFETSAAWQPIAGDFNGDGSTDYARLGDAGAWIFFGDPSGRFTSAFQSYGDLSFARSSAWQAIAGDFNGDGKTDYARLGDTGAWVFFAGADGSFTPRAQSYSAQFGAPSLWQAIAGDFDGDGKADYARLGDRGAWMFFGGADGSFTPVLHSYERGASFGLPSPWQAITGDFDGDGRTDYARLGDAGAWIFPGRKSRELAIEIQDYGGTRFGSSAASQVVTGRFTGGTRTGYARLGATFSAIFVPE